MTPKTIGRYTVLRELGHGAMGVVYEAEDPNIGRTVALKVVHTDQIGANREEVIRRFKNEARAAGNLNHPNIITIHDAGEHEGMLFIAMECVQGAALSDLMAKQGRMPSAKVVDIIRQVCLGLDFAHKRGIIHRDIKPANILISDSLVKISDFGIANVGDGMTITGTVVGTPNYMSPEQVLGKTLDGRSDLFSVGVMLYEMVTGERPFEGQSITTIMYKIVHEEPIAPRKLDSSIHPGLSAVVERALAKSPEMRFQTGAELAAALENYNQMPVGAATFGNLATADLPALPATASLTGVPTQPATQQQTIVHPPTTQQIPPPVVKQRRGFWSTFVLGCFGVIIVGIIAVAAIAIFATHYGSKYAKGPLVQVGSDKDKQGSTSSEAIGEVTQVSPPVASKTKATLKLDSDPPSAEILIDGKSVGKSTPATVTIPRGQHTVALHMSGFQDASAKFKVSGGEEFEFSPKLILETPGVPQINIPNVPGVNVGEIVRQAMQEKNHAVSEQQKAQLEALQKWGDMNKAGQPAIMINSHPSGAEIWVDGKDTGQKTPAVLTSTEGSHKVRLELEGQKPYERTVNIRNGVPAAINAHFGDTSPPASPTPPPPPQ